MWEGKIHDRLPWRPQPVCWWWSSPFPSRNLCLLPITLVREFCRGNEGEDGSPGTHVSTEVYLLCPKIKISAGEHPLNLLISTKRRTQRSKCPWRGRDSIHWPVFLDLIYWHKKLLISCESGREEERMRRWKNRFHFRRGRDSGKIREPILFL